MKQKEFYKLMMIPRSLFFSVKATRMISSLILSGKPVLQILTVLDSGQEVNQLVPTIKVAFLILN